MNRSCDVCGAAYEAKRPSSRYCSDTCRKRAQRGAVPGPSGTGAGPGVTSSQAAGQDRSTVGAVLAELERAGRAGTYLGAAALALAERIDSSTAVMGFAPLVKELRTTMEAALAGAVVEPDGVDEVERKRQEKLRRLGVG